MSMINKLTEFFPSLHEITQEKSNCKAGVKNNSGDILTSTILKLGRFAHLITYRHVHLTTPS